MSFRFKCKTPAGLSDGAHMGIQGTRVWCLALPNFFLAFLSPSEGGVLAQGVSLVGCCEGGRVDEVKLLCTWTTSCWWPSSQELAWVVGGYLHKKLQGYPLLWQHWLHQKIALWTHHEIWKSKLVWVLFGEFCDNPLRHQYQRWNSQL